MLLSTRRGMLGEFWVNLISLFVCLFLQRQALRSVPVSQVKYDWKDVSARFWVYGLDHKVHAPNYPQQCCCGCTIL